MSTYPYKVKSLVPVVILAVMIDKKDDLPAPDWPIIVKNSPQLILPFRLVRIILPDYLWINSKFLH
jgi:hypothetical protein